MSFCREEATRTPDPYVPNVVRYQLRYFSVFTENLDYFFEIFLLFFEKRVQRYCFFLNCANYFVLFL